MCYYKRNRDLARFKEGIALINGGSNRELVASKIPKRSTSSVLGDDQRPHSDYRNKLYY